MQITSKCIASLCKINRVRHVLDKKTLMTVINALVFSRLFYCCSVWGGISMKNVLKLQSVQNFAARIITSTRKYDHIHPILRDLNWLNVESTIKYRDGIMAFKCVNGYIPEYLCDQFILRSKIHSRNTRNIRINWRSHFVKLQLRVIKALYTVQRPVGTAFLKVWLI